MKLRFDYGPEEAPCQFDAPLRVIRADNVCDVPAALAEIDAARADGAWVAGFASYELGYALEQRLHHLMPKNRRLPLLQFGVFDEPSDPAAVTPGPASLTDLKPGWDQGRYESAFKRLHDYICAGDIYQVNLTFPIKGQASGLDQALYAALTDIQRVRYGVMLETDGLPSMLSRSPELFFRTTTTGLIETRPMKGTQPRSKDPIEDAHRIEFLRNDEKNQAENLMIVDLLRNDISRICTAGSVCVPELFTVESYETVHQMVSLIRGQMREGTGLSDILRALFPCGSITGAPKMRAMEIIAELEDTPREIYCGTIGWAAPDGRSEFNVAIRTLMIDAGDVTLNVGGGVVYDSTAESEYEEALWKSRFATRLGSGSA